MTEPSGDDPESVYRAYFSANIRPVIRAADSEAMRAALREITAHLSRLLRPGPAAPNRAGNGLAAGLWLYHDATRAVSAIFLRCLGFDPASAVGDAGHTRHVGRSLHAASARRLRRMLLDLADCLHATVAESCHAAQLSASITVPDDIREVAAGVAAGIGLYDNVVRAVAIHVMYYMWDSLSAVQHPAVLPFTGAFAADPSAIHLN